MQALIDANAPLDYIELEIFLSQNRYDAHIRYLNKTEKVASGLLEYLLRHCPEVKTLISKGSNVKYRINPPENPRDVKWFTKTTLMRLLHIIGSENLLNVTNSLKNEISQLEETRRFQLSLYAKGTEFQNLSGKPEISYSDGSGGGPKDQDSDASKNELLRAMDLRLNVLREKLTTAFDQTAGSTYSLEEMLNIEKFSHHIGDETLRDLLHTHTELRRQTEPVERSNSKQIQETNSFGSDVGDERDAKLISSDIPVKYGVSPAKAAQVERQSSTESDESSFSSDEEQQPSVERSRSLARSASPRRSASPMRRVQIGRSGSRRPTAITIKSLTAFPARDRSFFPRDSAASNSDEEETGQVMKKPETNVKRMSVQDAINLFENKQKNQTGDVQKVKQLSSSSSIGASRSVLRRWSSGMGEDSSQCCNDTFPKEDVGGVQNNNDKNDATPQSSHEVETEQIIADGVNSSGPSQPDVEVNSSENIESSPVVQPHESLKANKSTEVGEKVTSSAEWNRQKEAELNELLMKMMEAKPVRGHKPAPDVRKRQSLPSAQKGDFHENYKEKRDMKLHAQAATKRTDSDKLVKKTTKKTVTVRKSQTISGNATDAADDKQRVKKVQKSPKMLSQPSNSKTTESPKLGVVKKASAKGSSLPVTRQSWPSMPQQRAFGMSPASTPTIRSSSGAASTRRKSQPTTTPVTQSGPNKVDHKSQPQAKVVKPSQRDTKEIKKTEPERMQNPTSKPRKTSKAKVQTTPEDVDSAAKPSLYSKVTKKSSVVPLESKPFLRKGSGKISNNTTVKKKTSSASREREKKIDILVLDEKTDTVSDTSDQQVVYEETETKESKTNGSLECGISAQSFETHDEKEEVAQVEPVINDNGIQAMMLSEHKTDIEEDDNFISPTAWEIEEHEEQALTSANDTCQVVDSRALVSAIGASSPRVRHSLSQMLLQESIESDAIDWGNAENPPPIAYQKDAPKGLKRLLKFARKSKTDANSSGWSSPSVFSEGEDDADDSKSLNRKSSDNLLKKATLHSMNNGHQKANHEHPAQANTSKVNTQSLAQQFQESHVSSSITTTKATRSFFSLSAFKGGK